QRVPVPGHLLGAVGPGDRAERAGNTGGGRGAGHRRPVRGTASVTARLARGGVRGERVHGQALGVGEHSHPAGLAGLQRRRATTGLPVASTAAARTNPAITWSRNSQPMVGMFLKPVRYKSRWIAAVAASSPAPVTRSTGWSQPLRTTACALSISGLRYSGLGG